ncbi:MAG: hypothetical protein OXH92_05860 [Bryobacterales bacterium]|nr:hypothetical protein [Bryobacterales bacterium]
MFAADQFNPELNDLPELCLNSSGLIPDGGPSLKIAEAKRRLETVPFVESVNSSLSVSSTDCSEIRAAGRAVSVASGSEVDPEERLWVFSITCFTAGGF